MKRKSLESPDEIASGADKPQTACDDRRCTPSSWRLIVFWIVIVSILWFVISFAVFALARWMADTGNGDMTKVIPVAGAIGDTFGAANALFSALALVGVVYAILLQSEELSLQRKELILTRGEMERSADALSQQVGTSKNTALINVIASLVQYNELMVDKSRAERQRPGRSMYRGRASGYALQADALMAHLGVL